MKGLIRKDFLLIKRSMGSTLLILAFLVVLFSTMMGVSAGMAMIPLTFTILILGSFTLDDTAQWDLYALSTPTVKSRVVLAKYLSSILLTIIGAGLSVVTACVSLLLRGEPWSLEVTLTLLTSGGLAFFLIAVLLPLVYRFGANKARVVLMVVIFLPICLAALLKDQFPILSFSDQSIFFVLFSLPLIGALLLVPSYFISRAIYMRKDF